ncbi:MAG: glycoside hydrolase family 25 protein [Rhizobacter sp.]|nr:glycoside hydrolase family 25 protein [Bacteriovorax sp.]
MKQPKFLILLLAIIFSTNSYALGAKRPTVPVTPPSTGTGSTTTPTTPTTPSVPTASSFNNPWKSSTSTIVIDAYEGNSIDWDKMATDKKVGAVIHRATNGTKIDSQYISRKKIAKDRGYLWGAYHLAKKGDPVGQAKAFVSVINNELDTLMILDLEDTTSGSFMTTDEAVTFMNYVYEQTGRIPVIYANNTVVKELNSKLKNNTLFQQSKLWYARFKSSVTDYPAGIWSNYFLWQFSSEINCTATGSCLYNVPGTKFDMDVNVFYGTQRELADQWNN